jgi:hypothetical protein
MPWREALLTKVGPGAFSGVTLGDWLRVLRENHFSIDWPYWGRAAAITLGSLYGTVQEPVGVHVWNPGLCSDESNGGPGCSCPRPPLRTNSRHLSFLSAPLRTGR